MLLIARTTTTLTALAATLALAAVRPACPKVSARRAAFLEDLEFLLDNGVGEDEIMRRMGYRDRNTLRTRIHRAGRQDLADRLSVARRGDADLWRAA